MSSRLRTQLKLCKQRGDLEEAEKLCKQALADLERTSGHDHPAVAGVLNEMGSLSNDQRKYEEAERYFKRALGIYEVKSTGTDDLDVACTVNDLAYRHRKQNGQAKRLKRALKTREKPLGRDHLDVADVLRNMGSLYVQREKYEEAERYYERALVIFEAILAPHDLEIVTTNDCLAYCYYLQDKYEDAELVYEHVLSIREEVLGGDHPDVGKVLEKLGELYAKQDEFEDAERCLKRALEIYEAGSDDLKTVRTANALACCYHVQGKYKKAEQLWKRVLNIHEKLQGRDQSDVAGVLRNTGSIYSRQEKYEEAERYYKRALDIYVTTFGADSEKVATTKSDLAHCYYLQDKYEDAEVLCKQVLSFREEVLGGDHPEVANVLEHLGALYSKQDRYEVAEVNYKRAIEIYEAKSDGSDDLKVAQLKTNLADCYRSRAEVLYNEALCIREKILGSDHPCVVQVLNDLDSLYFDQHGCKGPEIDYETIEEIDYLLESCEAKVAEADDPNVVKLENQLANCQLERGKCEEHEVLSERAFGTDHQKEDSASDDDSEPIEEMPSNLPNSNDIGAPASE